MISEWLRRVRMRFQPHARLPDQPLERQPGAEPPRKFDPLRAAERDAIVASHLNGRLLALGFVQIAARRWVDGSTAPVRRVFSGAARWKLDGASHSTSCRIFPASEYVGTARIGLRGSTCMLTWRAGCTRLS